MIGATTASRVVAEAARRGQIDARARGLRVRWSATWCSELAEAAAGLPLRGCTHAEFELLASRPAAGRRFALVERKGSPVATLVLRRRGTSWTPVTSQCLPYTEFPSADGWAVRALAALGVPIVVPDSPVPAEHAGVSSLPFTPYAVDLETDYEDLLRSTGYRSTVANVRNRTKHLEVRIDEPDAVDWTVERWAAHWAGDIHAEASAADDMAALWHAMADRGKVTTVGLHDARRRVAGMIVVTDGRQAFCMCTARVDDLPKLSLGTAIIDRTIAAMRSLGVATLDLGGYSSYKHRMATAGPDRYTLVVSPTAARVAHRVRGSATRVAAKISRRHAGDPAE